MISCKQVAKALERTDYQNLGPIRKWALKLHVRLCGMCGNYHTHVMDMQDMSRGLREHEEDTAPSDPAPVLDDACKQRLAEALRAASHAPAPTGNPD